MVIETILGFIAALGISSIVVQLLINRQKKTEHLARLLVDLSSTVGKVATFLHVNEELEIRVDHRFRSLTIERRQEIRSDEKPVFFLEGGLADTLPSNFLDTLLPLSSESSLNKTAEGGFHLMIEVPGKMVDERRTINSQMFQKFNVPDKLPDQLCREAIEQIDGMMVFCSKRTAPSLMSLRVDIRDELTDYKQWAERLFDRIVSRISELEGANYTSYERLEELKFTARRNHIVVRCIDVQLALIKESR